MAITPTHHWTTLASYRATAEFPLVTFVSGDLYTLAVHQEATDGTAPPEPVFANPVLSWVKQATISGTIGVSFRGRLTYYSAYGDGSTGQITTTVVPDVTKGTIAASLVGWNGPYKLMVRDTETVYWYIGAGLPWPLTVDVAPNSNGSVVDAVFASLGWDGHVPGGGAWLLSGTTMLTETKLGNYGLGLKDLLVRQWDGTGETRSQCDNDDILGPPQSQALFMAAEIGPYSYTHSGWIGRSSDYSGWIGRRDGKSTITGRYS